MSIYKEPLVRFKLDHKLFFSNSSFAIKILILVFKNKLLMNISNLKEEFY